MAIVNRRSLPLAVHVASASPAEVRLVEATLEARFIADYPPQLIGDKAYDSDPLDTQLLETFGIELIAPHRANRRRPATQDGRSLRRYKRRWVVERFFAWLHNSRRLVTRWEHHVENFVGMLQLGCMRILLNRL
jgi:transposase